MCTWDSTLNSITIINKIKQKNIIMQTNIILKKDKKKHPLYYV